MGDGIKGGIPAIARRRAARCGVRSRYDRLTDENRTDSTGGNPRQRLAPGVIRQLEALGYVGDDPEEVEDDGD